MVLRRPPGLSQEQAHLLLVPHVHAPLPPARRINRVCGIPREKTPTDSVPQGLS
jgi:hypothetical protein